MSASISTVFQTHDLAGILVIGGQPSSKAARSVEFFSAVDDADPRSCKLVDLSRNMYYPTVNLVSGKMVTCYNRACDIFEEGTWRHLQDTKVKRRYHTSVTISDRILLIGGYYSKSTEWIEVDGSPGSEGPLTVRHGSSHCTMKISDEVVVVTGGVDTEDFVTEYRISDGRETKRKPLTQGRRYHACGVYQDEDGQQVSGEMEK